MRRFFKIILLSVLVSSVLTIAFFPRDFFLKLIEWKIKFAFRHHLQAGLSFDSLTWEKKIFSLDDIVIQKKGAWDAKIQKAFFQNIEGEKKLVLDGVTLFPKGQEPFSIKELISFLADSDVQTEVKNGSIAFEDHFVEWYCQHGSRSGKKADNFPLF